MKKLVVICTLFALALLPQGCGKGQSVAPERQPMVSGGDDGSFPAQSVASEIVHRSSWEFDSTAVTPEGAPPGDKIAGGDLLLDAQRTPLFGDVVHYSYQVRVGQGPYDIIGLHRVVKEQRPYRPIRTDKSIFLLHGDIIGFVKFIFGSVTPYLPDDQSIATYLAMSDVDVWGMDQNWALVPAQSDYSFAANWGIQNQVDNLRVGLAVARLARLLSGGGLEKLLLLGYSSGGMTGYAYLNDETHRPEWQRHVKGYICAESCFKEDRSDPRFEQARQWCCTYGGYFESLWLAGTYDTGWGTLFSDLGRLAETAPGDPSPYYPGMTNLQAALYAAANPDPTGFSPWYHYWAGVFGGDPPVPVDLRFTTVGACLDFLQTASPFHPVRFVVDYNKIICDEESLPYDDHLADISVPVFYLGAAGGFGEAGIYTLGLLGSVDKTVRIISLSPPETTDFAHIDLWTATNSMTDVFPPILAWVETHSGL